MTDDRLHEIIDIVKSISDQWVYTLPVDMEALCHVYGGKLTTLEDCEAMGLDRARVVACMGNKDGVATRGKRGWGIIYDKNAPVNRLRFTLAEEFMHTVLGHTLDRRFNALDPSYDQEVYMGYEEEAQIAAGLLLIPPPVWRRYGGIIGARGIGRLCGVSDACMFTWLDVMNKYADIMNKYANGIGAKVIWERIGMDVDRGGRYHPVAVKYE